MPHILNFMVAMITTMKNLNVADIKHIKLHNFYTMHTFYTI